MAHELDFDKNGKARMFSGEGLTPWHGLGTVIDGLATAEEALHHAGLDWKVNLVPIYQEYPVKWDENGKVLEREVQKIPDRFSAMRDIDHKSLGVVSKGYHVYDNVDAFTFLNNLTDTGSGDAVFSTAGALFGGKSVFMTMKIGDRFTVGDQDAHDLYLMATNSHDAKQSFTVSITPIRAVCNNTVTLGLAAAKTKWSLRHKVSLEGRVQDARDILKMSLAYEDAFSQAVQEMIDIQVTKQKFYEIIDETLPESPLQHDKDLDAIMNIWENEPTCQMGGGDKANGWRAFNAVTFWTDHKDYRTPESRFNSIIGSGVGTGLAEKMRPAVQKRILALA
jgi:phage/plasmid-like protein (TIGR03299 family)